ncbi:MAG: TonB-dependent receptor [Bacteroidales bacterium]|nr:TonB-dependent receptor [Bacteroidales bacterium]MCM1146341.1 TonB-dependent receptor [Bacteroidales bacterium]MCM1205221.1 TonB-dependent receptor [Bacillota bacterium]MCM1509694.1 TonB-dependent receptor [Clostridium sp.]
MQKSIYTAVMVLLACNAYSQNDTTDIKTSHLEEVTVTSRSGTRRMAGAVNGVRIGQQELFRAACCNLGESFTTNPSVDVSYSDAATGARQIRLLGLAGTYVQMLTENMPNFRGAAIPFALGYVPGTWMSGINVSKGCASVKNGYESISGQIDIDYLKPYDERKTNVNLYGDIRSRFEANFDTNFALSENLHTNILAHYENRWGDHDSNGDGFLDMPKVRQYNMNNRWRLRREYYIMHAGWSAMKEERNSGQTTHAVSMNSGDPLYTIGIETTRYEAYMKHAYILNAEWKMNLALMASGSLHDEDAVYGMRRYGVKEKNGYAQLMFETDMGEHHQLSTGVSINHDYFDERLITEPELSSATGMKVSKETVAGAYAQYTYTLGTRLTAMAGMRIDRSTLYGTFATPRMHVKWQPWDVFSIRLSAGKGYRTVHALAENNNLLASGRELVIDELRQEKAWNYGISTAFNIPVCGRTLKLNAEYYYTDFENQAVIDYEMSDASIVIHDLDGSSYSHVFQIDATYPFFKGFTATAAYRWNDVRCTYGGQLMRKPLASRYKALLTLSYKTPLELWQFDTTLQLNGGGRLPSHYGTFRSYEQLSAQITRKFRHIDIYLGGENLTDYRQPSPIINAANPWSAEFEPTLVYGPVDGAMAYLGVRIKL